MKKIAVTLTLWVAVAMANCAQAQYSDLYYHRVGDTIEWQAPNGYFSWWLFEQCFNENIVIQTHESSGWYWRGVKYEGDSAICLQHFYTPTPLKIIGIAGSPMLCAPDIDTVMWHDTLETEEYLVIYDVDSSGTMTLKAQAPWRMSDPHRILHIKTHESDTGWNPDIPDSCCWHHPQNKYLRIYEYYFDSAIYVYDSFYVGGTYFTTRFVSTRYRVCLMVPNNHYQNLCNPELQSIQQGVCAPQGVLLRMKSHFMPYTWDYSFSTAPWVFVRPPEVSLIYPIIEVDTTVPPEGSCIPIGNVQVLPSGTSATVSWDYFPNYTSVQLKYGHGAQATWTTIDVTDQTVHTLTGLEPTMPYGVTLQAFCDKEAMPWTEPVYFYTGQDTTTGGDTTDVSLPTILSAHTFMLPNPARDEVTISSSFDLTRIEIHDAAGVLVYSESVAGHQTAVNIGFMRPGTYIVTIQTHAGTTHKKLVVTR